jgi:hypothetical protein
MTPAPLEPAAAPAPGQPPAAAPRPLVPTPRPLAAARAQRPAAAPELRAPVPGAPPVAAPGRPPAEAPARRPVARVAEPPVARAAAARPVAAPAEPAPRAPVRAARARHPSPLPQDNSAREKLRVPRSGASSRWDTHFTPDLHPPEAWALGSARVSRVVFGVPPETGSYGRVLFVRNDSANARLALEASSTFAGRRDAGPNTRDACATQGCRPWRFNALRKDRLPIRN